jgi:hypothetical protein
VELSGVLLWEGKAPCPAPHSLRDAKCLFCLFIACLLLFFFQLVWAGFGRQRLGRQRDATDKRSPNCVAAACFLHHLSTFSRASIARHRISVSAVCSRLACVSGSTLVACSRGAFTRTWRSRVPSAAQPSKSTARVCGAECSQLTA